YGSLAKKIKDAGLIEACRVEERCLPGLVWMAGQGISFDVGRWAALAEGARREADRLCQALDAAAPPKPGGLFDAGNWGSPAQVKQALGLAGCPVASTAEEALAALDHPLAGPLRGHRDASKRVTTYGRDWLKHVAPDGRVYSGWRQCGAKTGRMSSG